MAATNKFQPEDTSAETIIKVKLSLLDTVTLGSELRLSTGMPKLLKVEANVRLSRKIL